MSYTVEETGKLKFDFETQDLETHTNSMSNLKSSIYIRC